MDEFMDKYRQGGYNNVTPPRPLDFTSDFLVAPKPSNENRRNKTLYYYRLDSDLQSSLQRIVYLAKQSFDVSSILINFLDQETQLVFQTHNFPVENMDRDISFCSHGILTPSNVFTIPDTHLDWRFQNNPLVKTENGIRFYAGAPIVAATTSNSHPSQDDPAEALGMVCLIDQQPRPALSKAETEMLKNLSALVGDYLDAHLTAIQLKERNSMSNSLIQYIDSIKKRENPFELAELLIKETLRVDTVTIYETEQKSVNELRMVHDKRPKASITKDVTRIVTSVQLAQKTATFTILLGEYIWESPDLTESAIIVHFDVHSTTYTIVCYTADPYHVLDTYDASYVVQFAQTITVYVQQSLITQMNDTKTTFMSSISHELRTPLYGILTSSELLLEEITATQRGLVEMIQLSGKNLINVINGFLDLNRWEAKAVQENKEAFDPLEMQQEIADTFAFSQTADLGINLTADPQLAKWIVEADETIAKQIILNLMDNAVRFTERGCVSMSLFIKQSVEETKMECHVIDTGKGISPDFIKEGLFVPFKKENSFSQGLGLSLAVSKHLADSTRSCISLNKSERGVGTHFVYSFPVTLRPRQQPLGSKGGMDTWILFPQPVKMTRTIGECQRMLTDFLNVGQGAQRHTDSLLRIVEYDDLQSDSQLVGCNTPTILVCNPDLIPMLSDGIVKSPHLVVCTKPVGVPRLQAALKELATKHIEQTKKIQPVKRILIVDDNSVNRNMLAMYCRKRKFYFETACDGLEAIEKFKVGTFNTIFMDIQMPNCDGPTAVQHIRRAECDQFGVGCTIIMLTGLSATEMTNTSKEAGADAIFGKPISLKTLDSILGVAL